MIIQETSGDEGYVFLSAFGIFMEDFDVTKDSVSLYEQKTSIIACIISGFSFIMLFFLSFFLQLDEYLRNWASMSESVKSRYVSMAAARMAEHEELTVAYVISVVVYLCLCSVRQCLCLCSHLQCLCLCSNLMLFSGLFADRLP